MIRLKGTIGEAFRPHDFAERFGSLLSDREQSFLRDEMEILSAIDDVPNEILTPRIAAEEDDGHECIVCKQSGARSAVWQSENIQFKGCRPKPNHAAFPVESLALGAHHIQRSEVPYGVMTAEAVVRELLGFCFCRRYGIPCATQPLCIYRYAEQPERDWYCLVLRVQNGRRAEAFQKEPCLSVGQLLGAVGASQTFQGSEVQLEGLNGRWYSHEKSRWLATLHFLGGFRGPLNNNIGNDVIVAEADGEQRLLFCDFDTFKLVEIPQMPTTEFIKDFALQCVLEVVKGSLPILQHVKVSSSEIPTEAAREVGHAYRQKSSLWNAYREHARVRVKERGWNWHHFEEACLLAFETPAFLEASCSVILSDYALERFKKRSLTEYVPH